MKLSTRIALSVGAVTVVLVAGAGWSLIHLLSADLHAQQDQHLRERAAVVAEDARSLLRATAAGRSPGIERNRERRLYNAALDVGIRLVGRSGTSSGGPQPRASVPLPLSAPDPVTVREGEISWRALSVPVIDRRSGADGTLWVFSPDTAADQQFDLVRARVVAVACATAPLAALLAGAVATCASRPLRRLQERTSGLDPRTSSARLDHQPTRVTEVDDLAATLQTVLARYDEQAARTAEGLTTARSFSAAASHELRTPLMSMQTNLEVLAAHPELGALERAEVLADLHQEHTRLLKLLVMLRELGRGDLVENEVFGPVDLAEIADASVSELRRRHPDADISLTCQTAARLHGWEPGLRIVLDNLLANALIHGRHLTQSARITVALRAETRPGGEELVLTVDDHGPGIPSDTRESVFERFARRPGSPGSGLGLTLVAQHVALHRGRISIADGPDGSGSRFEVRLPLPDSLPSGEMLLPPRRDWMIETAAHVTE